MIPFVAFEDWFVVELLFGCCKFRPWPCDPVFGVAKESGHPVLLFPSSLPHFGSFQLVDNVADLFELVLEAVVPGAFVNESLGANKCANFDLPTGSKVLVVFVADVELPPMLRPCKSGILFSEPVKPGPDCCGGIGGIP